MQKAFQVATIPIYQAEKSVGGDLCQRFVKRFPFAASSGMRNIDPCHGGSHEWSHESSNMRCIRLCRKWHERFDSGPKWFDLLHHLNVLALIHRFDAHPESKTKEN